MRGTCERFKFAAFLLSSNTLSLPNRQNWTKHSLSLVKISVISHKWSILKGCPEFLYLISLKLEEFSEGFELVQLSLKDQ